MARPQLMDAPALEVLTTDGGFQVPANCPHCESGWTVEGKSRGREDIAGACLSVSAVLFCVPCRRRWRLDVVLTSINGGY